MGKKKRTADWWRTSTKFWVMMDWLGERLSKRKRILFGCATARLVWERVTRPANRAAIEMAERYVDGLVPRESFERAWQTLEWEPAVSSDWHIVALTDGAPYHIRSPKEIGRIANTSKSPAELATTEKMGSDALRDVVGDPFDPVTIDPAWLAFDDRVAVKLADAIYEERRFGDLPVLADALEDAGCASRQLLDHLRAPGPHFRGCWAVDLVLGKS